VTTEDHEADAAVEALVKHASEAPLVEGQPARIRVRTMATGAATALLGGAALVGAAPLVSAVLAVGTGVGAVVCLSHDLEIPAPRERHTPKQAATCFAKALRRGQFAKAYSCCHPETLAERVNVPEIERLGLKGDSSSWQRLQAFEKFWKVLLRGGGSSVRYCHKVIVDEPVVDGERASVRVTFKMIRYSTWVYLGLAGGVLPMALLYLLNRKSGDVECRLDLFRHRSQWWVLPSSPYDASGPRQLAPAKARYLGPKSP